MRKTEVIFIQSTSPGHLIPTVEFSKRLIARDSRLSVTILVINTPYPQKASLNPAQESHNNSSPLSSAGPIRYVQLPQVDPPPPELFKESIELAVCLYVASYGPHVKDAIVRLQDDVENPVHVAALFIDMFFTSLIDVANELRLPSYLFFCSSAAFLGLLLHLPDHSDQVADTRFDESDPDTVIPCFQDPVPTRVLPDFVFNRARYGAFMDDAKRYRETKGIIINTFAELEPYAVNSFSNAYQTAPVYTVGPVLDLFSQVHKPCDEAERERITRWLDKQPESSVVFLCFGSGGSFGEDQIREISRGLRQSGQRFLWSMRKPPTEGFVKPTEYSEIELRGILDDEFWFWLEKQDQGLVCGWAPQVEILAHKSVGAFVSHCGWNSTLEGLWFGKPIVTWPLYADQQINAFELARELGVAVELTLDYRIGSSNVVEGSEVERAVMCVMDKDNPIRYKAKEMAEVCRRTLLEGGSSFGCVDGLISEIVGDLEVDVEIEIV